LMHRVSFYPSQSLPKSDIFQLLSSEIKMTVSNLSQATSFLVENDFLNGVELYPGQSARKAIVELNPVAPPHV
jgi:hypothetical protein